MAIFKKSGFGGLSGKIGQFVIYEMNGKQVVRVNAKPDNPKTAAQVAQRAKFSLASRGMSPLNKIVKIGYRNREMSFGKLIGLAYRDAIIGEYPDLMFDYSKVSVSEGRVQLPGNINIETGEGSNMVSFSWDTNIIGSSKQGRDNDLVNIVCLNSSIMFAEHSLHAAKRSAGKADFEIPAGWMLKDLHFWLFLSSNDTGENSDSLYLLLD